MPNKSKSAPDLDDLATGTGDDFVDLDSRSMSSEMDFPGASLPLEDDDREIKFAKEMALAIQQNPNLTPAELRELMAKSQARSPPPRTSSKKSPLLKSIKSSVKKAFKTPERSSSAASDFASPRNAAVNARFQEVMERASVQEHSEAADTDTVDGRILGADLAGSIRIMGIIWKRRSGLGKYSTTAAWERRRVVLKGSKLYYYRTRGDRNDESGDEEMDDDGTRDISGDDTTPSKSKTWLETMAGTHKASKKEARGYLDLVKDNACVCPSSGHSGAPTPFAISIKILSQTKWKLCFDTHGELMQWLAAMTDVIVQGSVDDYNAAILAVNDPSRITLQGGMYHGQLSEPPLIANSGTKLAGHRLWATGHYKVQSENYPDRELDDISEHDLDDLDSDDDTTSPIARTATTAETDDLIMELEGGKDMYGVPAQYIWQWGVLWNAAIILARASSTTVESFWYLITFANIALFGFMSRECVGGKVKSIMTPRMARRLSNGLGIPLASTSKEKVKNIQEDKMAELPVAIAKPKAGTTSMRIQDPTDLPVNKDGHVFAGWRWAKPEMMLVRSHNYKKDKIKVPSPGELYKCVHVDIFESRHRFPDMASRVEIPKLKCEDVGPKTWNSPDTFVVSIAIPTDPPKLYSGSSEDGGGYTVTVYFQMHQETRDILKRVTADGYDPSTENYENIDKSKVNAVRLLEEWCRRASTDDAFCARFKVLPNAQNLKEIGLPSWISKYNGKPFLIKRPGQTGFLYRHPDKSCIEFDISLHPFPYLAKQGICFMKDTYFKKVLVTFGFLIEGRAEDELPECLIGLMQLCYPDPIHAIQGEDLMAGKSPKSFE